MIICSAIISACSTSKFNFDNAYQYEQVSDPQDQIEALQVSLTGASVDWGNGPFANAQGLVNQNRHII